MISKLMSNKNVRTELRMLKEECMVQRGNFQFFTVNS